jgi:hypothetical protein
VGVTRWVGVAAMLAASPVLRTLDVPPGWSRPIARWAPAFVVAVACLVLLWPLWLGTPPASRDHGIHYYQVHLLVDELLPQHRLSGWVDDFNNGYPYGESYPVVGYLWCAAPHLLTFGAISLRHSYAFGVLGLWLLAVLACWRLGRLVGREISGSPSVARWTAAAASLLWLADPGGSRLGGWAYTMFHGVWAQLLSSSLWTLALTLQWDAWRRPSPRRLALAAFLLAASVLAHPFGILTAVVSGVIWLGVLTVSRDADALPGGRLRWWLLMHVGAALMAAGWLATFFVAAESMRRSPVAWEPLSALAASLVRGDLFAGPWVWAGPAALVGIYLLARRGGAYSWLVLGCTAAMLVLASHDAITVLRLDLLLSGFKNLQFPRWSMAIKPMLFVVSAAGLVATVRAVATAAATQASPRVPTSIVPRFVAALLLAPLLAALAPELQRLAPRPVGAIDTLDDADLVEADAALVTTLRAERETSPQPIRVAFLRRGMTGAMWPLLALADAHAPIVVDGHVATINFRHHVISRNPAVLAALGVTHVLWDGNLLRDEDLLAQLQTVGRFGPFTLARLTRTPHRVDAELLGSGELTIEAAADGATSEDGLRMTLRGTAADSKLILHTPPHPKWRLQGDGTSLPLQAWGSAFVRSRVVAPGDGTFTLAYVDSARERRARILSWLTAAIAFVGLMFGRPFVVARFTPSRRLQRLGTIAAGVGLVVALLVVAWRQQTQLAERWTEYAIETRPARASPLSYVRDLVVEDDVQSQRTPAIACSGLHTKNVLEGCIEADHAPRIAILYDEPYLYRCRQVSVPPRGQVRLTFDGVRPDQVVLGTLVHPGESNRELSFAAGDPPRPLGRRARRLRLTGDALGPQAGLVVENPHRQPQRICLAAAVFDTP